MNPGNRPPMSSFSHHPSFSESALPQKGKSHRVVLICGRTPRDWWREGFRVTGSPLPGLCPRKKEGDIKGNVSGPTVNCHMALQAEGGWQSARDVLSLTGPGSSKASLRGAPDGACGRGGRGSCARDDHPGQNQAQITWSRLICSHIKSAQRNKGEINICALESHMVFVKMTLFICRWTQVASMSWQL